MSTREERIRVFNDTIDWIKNDAELTAAVAHSKLHTSIFYEDTYPAFDMTRHFKTEITVTGDRSYQAAMRLAAENKGCRIAVMNFANAFHPGGGVKTGASAQEECLCRTSTLYPCLERHLLRENYYRYHQNLNNPKATDRLIYMRDIVICKTDEDRPKRMPREQWTKVDVITVAAPDLRPLSNVHMPLVGDGAYMNNAELFGYHVKRAIHVLTVAANKKADILVLGAFGCGAFQNDPEVVARAYKTAIEEFPKAFKKIEFAVYCTPGNKTNYDVFSRVLGAKADD